MAGRIFPYLVPHPPTLLEDELHGRPSAIRTVLRREGERLREMGVQTVIAASTHWQPADIHFVDGSAAHDTLIDYSGFEVELQYDCTGHPALAAAIAERARAMGIPVQMARRGVDHAVTVPLHFLAPDRDLRVVPVSVSRLPYESSRAFGSAIRMAALDLGEPVLFLATGALSHDLAAFVYGRPQSAYGRFDRAVLDLLSRGQGSRVTELPRDLIATAKPEGGFRDLFLLAGIFGQDVPGEVLAYESLPGVGMAVVRFPAVSLDREPAAEAGAGSGIAGKE